MRKTLVATFLLVASFHVHADTADVSKYFRDMRSLQAGFYQTVYDSNLQVIESSSGLMYMLKPGRFRWDYREPNPQLIVADGEKIWLYDKEMEQVTVRAIDQALGSTPLALLTGDAPIENSFVITSQPSEDSMEWYSLSPMQEDVEFTQLRIAFAEGEMKVIDLVDAFGQTTRLQFNDLERDVEVPLDLVSFTPPEGVDVLSDF